MSFVTITEPRNFTDIVYGIYNLICTKCFWHHTVKNEDDAKMVAESHEREGCPANNLEHEVTHLRETLSNILRYVNDSIERSQQYEKS